MHFLNTNMEKALSTVTTVISTTGWFLGNLTTVVKLQNLERVGSGGKTYDNKKGTVVFRITLINR